MRKKINVIELILKKINKSTNKKYFLFSLKILYLIIVLIYKILAIYIELFIKYNYNNLNNKINLNKINLAIFAQSIKNGGCERQTSLILYYFNKVKFFELFLFTIRDKEDNEYYLDKKIKRIVIRNNLIEVLMQKKIDILIYQFYNITEIELLNNITKIKTIFINRSCFLHWIYYNAYSFYKTLYKNYKNSKYIISLIPFENDYLFRKWGINSILMNNFIPYNYKSLVPSKLSSKTILMIGRADDPIKRFELGIKSMKYIIKEIPECQMKIISYEYNIQNLKNLIIELNLEKNVKFVGYLSNPEKYYKDASLHIFPTLAEAFPNILSETLSYGIPSILVGLDYVSLSKGGTVIIYDDSPLSIAKIAINILKNKQYRKKLGKEARNNIKKYENELLLKKWVKLIISIYLGEQYYEDLKKKENLNETEAVKVLENQINLLKLRKKEFKNITIKDILNFTFMENLNKFINK